MFLMPDDQFGTFTDNGSEVVCVRVCEGYMCVGWVSVCVLDYIGVGKVVSRTHTLTKKLSSKHCFFEIQLSLLAVKFPNCTLSN